MRECIVRISVFLREVLVPCTRASGTAGTGGLKSCQGLFLLSFCFGFTELATPLSVAFLAKWNKAPLFKKQKDFPYFQNITKMNFIKHLIINSVPHFVLGSGGVGGWGGYPGRETWAMPPHVAHSPMRVWMELSLNFKSQTEPMKMFVGSGCLQHWELPIPLFFKLPRSVIV